MSFERVKKGVSEWGWMILFMVSMATIMISVILIVRPPIHDCEDLGSSIIKMTKGNEFQRAILKLYDIEPIEHTNPEQIMNCAAVARLGSGGTAPIQFHMEEDVDGDRFIGYEPLPGMSSGQTKLRKKLKLGRR